jgi:hypothetical protein
MTTARDVVAMIRALSTGDPLFSRHTVPKPATLRVEGASMRGSRRAIALATLLVALAAPAAADTSYAIVVGSNAGGAGQTDLRFAEDDARRVGDLLTELGGYATKDVTTIVAPDPDKVLAAIATVTERATADVAAGHATTVFFYYSGHAKAAALNLGDQELALAVLRERLLGIPSTLTVVVLDACQSGAFSRVKGAEPAADFSFNSKSRLDASGVAVLASSTASELSQESDILESSYFTHHLLVGLRGAADQSEDGRVTIDEAYRYAYHQTLLATAATAVGSQHVSLEVDLKGHGEVPLSYPEKATAQLELPAKLAGDVLIERKAAQAVLAELHKVAGKPVRVAVAPGEYDVLVRHDKVMERCPVAVRAGATATVDLAQCDDVPQVDAGAKGGILADGRRMTLVLTLSAGGEMKDEYSDRLADFGYGEPTLAGRLALTGLYRLSEHVQLGGALAMTASPSYHRSITGEAEDIDFSWTTTTLLAMARTDVRPAMAPRLSFYAQIGAGAGMARTTLVDAMQEKFHETSFGPALVAGGGLYWEWRWLRRAGMGLGYTFQFAPILENLTGDRHLGVGHFVELNLGYRF